MIRFAWQFGPSHWPFNATLAFAVASLLGASAISHIIPLGVLYYAAYLVQAAWLAIGGMWCVTSLLVILRKSEPKSGREWRWAKWWIAPVTAILLFDSHGSHVVQFWTLRPQLEQKMAALVSAPPTTRRAPDGAEEFDSGDIHRLSGGVFRFRYELGNPFDWNGYAYSPKPLPERDDASWQYIHIVGPWYVCYGG